MDSHSSFGPPPTLVTPPSRRRSRGRHVRENLKVLHSTPTRQAVVIKRKEKIPSDGKGEVRRNWDTRTLLLRMWNSIQLPWKRTRLYLKK